MNPEQFDNQSNDANSDVTRQVWLAGLGAFTRAQAEGSKVFDALVAEGQIIDAQMKKAASETADQVKDGLAAVKDKVGEIRDKATDGWSKLEEVFQARVAQALNRLGVPTHADIQQLREQVERLTQNIQQLNQALDAEKAPAQATLAQLDQEPSNS